MDPGKALLAATDWPTHEQLEWSEQRLERPALLAQHRRNACTHHTHSEFFGGASRCLPGHTHQGQEITTRGCALIEPRTVQSRTVEAGPGRAHEHLRPVLGLLHRPDQ